MIILTLVLLGTRVSAYVAASSNYRLERDSINIGGGFSSSTSYLQESTVGEVATGYSSSTTYMLHAGYQQVDTSFISISSPADITLLPAISTQSGGQADGSAAWTVTTNSSAGYTLAIRASASPALVSGANSFADYTAAGVSPDYAWAVTTAAKEFGFSPEGTHIHSRYRDNGATCNVGALDTSSACWDALSTSDRTIATSGSANNPAGTDTTVRFRAEAGSSSAPAEGSYQATVTLTALAI